MSAYVRTRRTLAALFLGVASLSGCGGWRVRDIAPNQLSNEISRGAITLPQGTTPLEGRWRESSMHGSGLLLRLSMTPAAYKKFRSDPKFKPILSSRDTSEEAVRAKVPPVIRDRWEIKRAPRQVLEAGETFGTCFAAIVEPDGAATVYFSQFY